MKKTLRILCCRLLLFALLSGMSSASGETLPLSGGVLRWRDVGDPPKLDPAGPGDTSSGRNIYLMFETLVENAPDGERLLPRLAESWEGSEGGRVWTFHLRKGVRFHSTIRGRPSANGGREAQAADWKYSFERLVRTKSPRAYFVDMIQGYKDFAEGKASEWTGIKVVDEHTIRFELEYAFAPFVSILAYNAFVVLPREDAERSGVDFSFNPVGTGPFILEKWEHDQQLIYTRNPDFWMRDAHGNALPYLDGVEIVIIPDDTIAYEELKKGNIDVLPELPDEFYADAKQRFGDLLQERPMLGIYYVGFNCAKPPFKDNKTLRKALNYAVNKQAMSDYLLEGRYAPARGVLPPGVPGYSPDLEGYEYSPETARKMLAEAGIREGFQIELLVNNNLRHRTVAEGLQGLLAEFGIDLRVSVVDWGVHLDLVDRGETQMYRMSWIADYADPDNFLYVLFYSQNRGVKGNYSYYSNDRVDELLTAARVETDFDKRMGLYREAERIIVDDAPWMFLFYYTTSLLGGERVQDMRLPSFGQHTTPLEAVWITR